MDFTKKEISEISGLTPRLVQFYTEQGLILPEKNTGEGRGNVRRFSRESLFDFLIIADLSKYGITKLRISNCLKFLKTDPNTIDYFKNESFKKNISLFVRIYTQKNSGKIIADTKMIGGANSKTGVVTFDEFQKFSSVLIIDIGQLAEKANMI